MLYQAFPLHNHLFHQRQSISLPRRDIVEDPPPLRRAESNTPGQADWRRAILDDLDGEQ